MKKILSYLLIIIGIGTIFFPKLKDLYFSKKGEEVLGNWEKISNQFEAYDQDSFEYGEELLEPEKREDIWKDIGEDVDGILNIEKIDFFGPILKEITEYNLNIGVTKIEEKQIIGQIGNYSIAGHRSRRYGRHFNRLGELEKGDEIEIITEEDKYTYIVYDKMVVKSEDTWVLESNNKDKLITLVTCDYSMKPTGRLIIKGKMKE